MTRRRRGARGRRRGRGAGDGAGLTGGGGRCDRYRCDARARRVRAPPALGLRHGRSRHGRVAEDVSLVGDSRGRDFCARDETGHGSHVAGIIGARGLSMQPRRRRTLTAAAGAGARGGAVRGRAGVRRWRHLRHRCGDQGRRRHGRKGAEHVVRHLAVRNRSLRAAAARGLDRLCGGRRLHPGSGDGQFRRRGGVLPRSAARLHRGGRDDARRRAGGVLYYRARTSRSRPGRGHLVGEPRRLRSVLGHQPRCAVRFRRRGAACCTGRPPRPRSYRRRGARGALPIGRAATRPNPETGWGMLDIPAALRHLDAMEFTTTEAAA